MPKNLYKYRTVFSKKTYTPKHNNALKYRFNLVLIKYLSSCTEVLNPIKCTAVIITTYTYSADLVT